MHWKTKGPYYFCRLSRTEIRTLATKCLFCPKILNTSRNTVIRIFVVPLKHPMINVVWFTLWYRMLSIISRCSGKFFRSVIYRASYGFLSYVQTIIYKPIWPLTPSIYHKTRNPKAFFFKQQGTLFSLNMYTSFMRVVLLCKNEKSQFGDILKRHFFKSPGVSWWNLLAKGKWHSII